MERKDWFFLILISFLSGILYLANIQENMIFFGDAGWYYLQARDMLRTGSVPLVGIESSRVWLHQGPLWTYVTGVALWVGRYNPIGPAVVTACAGIACIASVYYIARKLKGRFAAVCASLMLATSPLMIVHMRMPFQTALIPLCVGWFVYLSSRIIIRGTSSERKAASTKNVWLTGFLAGLLYNVELVAIIFPLTFMVAILFQWLFQSKKTGNLLKMYGAFFAGGLIPMLPILLYDIQNGFKQTIIFAGWIGYRLLQGAMDLFGFAIKSRPEAPSEVLTFASQMIERFFVLGNSPASRFIFVTLLLWMIIYCVRSIAKKSLDMTGLFAMYCLIGILAIFVNGVPSEAYVPMLFPLLAILLGIAMRELSQQHKFGAVPIFLCIGAAAFINIFSLQKLHNLVGEDSPYGPSFHNRLDVAQSVVKSAAGSPIVLKATGPGSQFPSYTMNSEYLIWYLGGQIKPKMTHSNPEDVYTLYEQNGQLYVKK